MITYNHERFIEQAVRSVMMQETDFDYELIIGEDCSTDRTREIVLRLKEEFPDKIRLLLHPQNVGMIPNFVAVYNACDGEYIALLEGDDYWTDPKKLQIQVDYMEAHPECRLSFHGALVQDESRPSEISRSRGTKKVGAPLRLCDILHRNEIITCTVLFRSRKTPLPEWYFQLRYSGDWPLYVVILSQGGYAACVTDIPMAIYRVHNNSVSAPIRNKLNRDADHYVQRLLLSVQDIQLVQQIVPVSCKKYFRMRLFHRYLSIAKAYARVGRRKQSRKYIAETLMNVTHGVSFSELKTCMKIFLYSHLYIYPHQRI